MSHKHMGTIDVECPACGRVVNVAVMLAGIETRGLSLVDVSIYGTVRHDCPEQR